MKVVTGVLKEVGDGIVNITLGDKFTRYSYIEMDKEIIRNVLVYTGIDSKLSNAVDVTGEVTLYLSSDRLIGIKFPDGKTYRSNFRNGSFLVKIAPFILALNVLLGIITIPFLGLGFFILYFTYLYSKYYKAVKESFTIPNAIPI